jgi:Tat protein secretion system quality control protein TatD with DNase activity
MNQPAYLPYTAKKIAELKDIDLATVIKATTNNFIKMFPTVALL